MMMQSLRFYIPVISICSWGYNHISWVLFHFCRTETNCKTIYYV